MSIDPHRDWPTNPTPGEPWQPSPQPQYGPPAYPAPQPGAYPPPPPPILGAPPPRKKNRVPIIVGGIGGALLLICCGGVLILGATDNHKTTSNTAAVTTTTGAPAAQVTTQAAPPPPPSPAAPKTILTLKGSGIKKTALFTTGDEWSLKYTYDCTKTFGGTGNFQVWETQSDGSPGDVLVNELDAKGADEVPQHNDSGTHYLQVNSECSWTITVVG